MTVQPLKRVKKVIKRSKRFTKFEHEDFPHKLKPNWRRPRGIDCRVRRQFKGCKPLVKIGYGTRREHRHILPNGFRKLLIRNEKDLELLLMNNRTYCGELAHNLSSLKKKKIVERAAQLNVKIINGKSKVVVEEKNAE